jgi:hypothetical protein
MSSQDLMVVGQSSEGAGSTEIGINIVASSETHG